MAGAFDGGRTQHQVVEVRSVADARRAVASLREGEVPVAVGGDGTVRLIVHALDAEGMTERTFAVIPLGTGNAFAHSAGVGTVPAALDALARGMPRRIDLLRTTHPASPIAVASLSLGFEARFVSRYGRWRRGVGRTLAAAGALRECMAWPPADFSLWIDGEPWVRTGDRVFNAGLYATRCYAFGRVIFPASPATYGAATAALCESARSYAGFLAGAGGAARMLPARGAVVESRGPVQVDGETVGPADFDIRVDAGALRVLASTESP
jgi:diacylglycerol kinase family enzyme